MPNPWDLPDELPADLPVARCELPDGRAVSAVQEAEAHTLWEEISSAAPYRRAAEGLRPDEAVVDVGAHIGLASLLFARLAPDSRLIAFEPAPKAYTCLEENLARHLPGATACRQALGATPGKSELIYRPYVASASTLYDDAEDDARNLEAHLDNIDADERTREVVRRTFSVTRRVPVEVTTLTAVMTEHQVERVGLLKIDVERGELDVLDGIDPACWPRIRRVLLEVHDIDGRLGQVVSRLVGLGFRATASQWGVYVGGSVHLVLAERD
ncbi:FkbM family methyltransferase [Streptomyces sp. WMMC940]|uniref:FkbM family methyltransferase n=1 Tax=Streptomyces sp. WMMC940 TaxID=3015153 RepID=UPI0022B6FC04|nr:FkbM family methyltransferase [Streptomyces sp. WMMC940]MCZ7457445.1 FkbM family methyltransferase [Streptomyces sp. WMMC940]